MIHYYVALLLLCVSCVLYADDKPLIVGSEQNYPPFALGMTDKEADGFTVELWREVAKENHLNFTIRVMPFHDVLREFKQGNIDVLINIAQSDERHQFADFTVPHVVVNGAIFVRRGDRRIHDESDLNDKKIIVLNADLAHDYAIQKGWQQQLILVDTSEQGFQLLADGRYDALLLSRLVGKQTIDRLDIHNIEALPIKVGFAQKFSFAVHKGNAELLAKINEGLALTKASGVYDQLYEKWFGIYEEQALLPLLIRYLIPIAICFIIILSVLLYKRHVEQKQALLALQESESRFRDLFENAPLPYQSLTPEGQFLYVNQAWLELVDCKHAQAIGHFFHEFVADSAKNALACMLDEIKGEHAGSIIMELQGARLVLVKWQVAKDKRVHCILIDITERYQAEQTLKENQLALATAHADLVQFTYVAAHHLQEPSRRVVTFVQHLKNQLQKYDCLHNDEINITLTFIEQSTMRQKALVRDIQLYLAAIKPIGQIEQIPVITVVASVIRHHAQRIRDIGGRVDCDNLLSVHLDLPRLYDIFNILLDNALRYYHPDRPLNIKISAENKAGRVHFRIADNGIGIPEDCRERVFVVFERLQINDNSNSTGIGLSIVQRIVSSCHGKITIEETVGGGTTVLFDLPE